MCECCTPSKFIGSGLFLLLLCGCFIALSILVPPWLQKLLTKGIVDQRVVTSNSSTGWDIWASNTYSGAPPQYFKVYAFNVTNAQKVLEGLEKPKLQQLGPYIYDWKWHNFDVTFSNDTDYVTFFKAEKFIFNRNLTAPTLDPYIDKCTFPSLPFAGVRAQLRQSDNEDVWWQSLVFDLLSSAASCQNCSAFAASQDETNPFITKTVHEYIWGYDSQFLLWINNTLNQGINHFFSIQQNSTSDAATKAFKKSPDVMFTGKSDTKNLNQYISWQGKSNLTYPTRTLWGSNDANTVKGSDGLGFDIDIKDYESQTVWVENLFRHIRFVSNQTVQVQGIDLSAYFIDQSEFNNVTTNPAYYLWAPNGLSNLTAANAVSQGSPVPVMMTQPLFFQSDPFYMSQVEFLPPNNIPTLEDHNTFIFVEPHTGITMQAFKRLQVNLQLQGSFLLYPKMQQYYIPVVWFEETASITTDLADKWKRSVGVVVALLMAVPILGYSLSGLMLLLAGSMFVLAYTRRGAHEYQSVATNSDIQYVSKS